MKNKLIFYCRVRDTGVCKSVYYIIITEKIVPIRLLYAYPKLHTIKNLDYFIGAFYCNI